MCLVNIHLFKFNCYLCINYPIIKYITLNFTAGDCAKIFNLRSKSQILYLKYFYRHPTTITPNQITTYGIMSGHSIMYIFFYFLSFYSPRRTYVALTTSFHLLLLFHLLSSLSSILVDCEILIRSTSPCHPFLSRVTPEPFSDQSPNKN